MLKYLRILLMVLYWQLPQSHKDDFLPRQQVERELTKRKKRKKIYPKRERHLSERRRPAERCYRSSQTKDKRYSNQRMLRRMYRNC